MFVWADHQETNDQLDARYVNCLKFSIEDELNMHSVYNMEEGNQLALNVEEEKLTIRSKDRGEKGVTPFASWGGFNYDIGESSQGDKKAKDTQQDNLNQLQGRGFHRGIGYNGGKIIRYWSFRCGVYFYRGFECLNYNMQESNKGKNPSLNLVKAKNEEEEMNMKSLLVWGKLHDKEVNGDF